MEFKLPIEVETPEELRLAIHEIERYLEWRRSSQISQKVGADDASAAPTLGPSTRALIEAAGGKSEVSVDDLRRLLADLERLELPVLHLVLADIAPPMVRRKLVEWVRANVDSQALVQLVTDRTIGGGVIIRTPNHLYDHSFRTQLVAKRDRLLKVMANVR